MTGATSLDNRFAVLRPKEPAPGVQEVRHESTVPVNPGFGREGREGPITLPLRNDMQPADQPSSSEKIQGRPLAPISSLLNSSKRPSVSRLAPYTSSAPATPTPTGPNQLPSARMAARIIPTKPQAQPSLLAVQIAAQSARASKVSSASNWNSPEFTTAAPHRLLLPSLPSPPIPPDPMAVPSLATLPMHPALDFKRFTSPNSSEPKPPQFAVPLPMSTGLQILPSDDEMFHIVSSTSGKIFWMAAEIAAANEKSTARPVGNALIPAHALRFGKVKEKVDRKMLDRTRGDYVHSREDTEDESEDEETEGEGWIGSEEGFVSTFFDVPLPLHTRISEE